MTIKKQGGGQVFTPPVYPVPDFGGIDNPSQLRVAPVSYPELATMFDPTRILAARERALAQQRAAQEKNLNNVTRHYTSGYDEVFGEYHNESQRRRLEQLRIREGIKNPGEIDLNNEAEIRDQYQRILRAKDAAEFRDVAIEVELAKQQLKFAPSGLEAQEAEGYTQAQNDYMMLADGDHAATMESIKRLNPAVWRTAAEERRVQQKAATLSKGVQGLAFNNYAGYTFSSPQALRDLEDPNSDYSRRWNNIVTNHLYADDYTRRAAVAAGYLQEQTDANGQVIDTTLTEKGWEWAVDMAWMAGTGVARKEALSAAKSAASRQAKTDEKSTELAGKYTALVGSIVPGGAYNATASLYPDLQEFTEQYPTYAEIPAEYLPCFGTGLNTYDSNKSYSSAEIRTTLQGIESCIKGTRAGRPATGSAQPQSNTGTVTATGLMGPQGQPPANTPPRR